MKKKSDESINININKTMVVETNYACNLRCIHCYVPHHKKEYNEFIDYKELIRLFDQLEACGFRNILFTGGEPLAHPHFCEIYENAWDRGFFITVFTNGVLMDKALKLLFIRKKPALIRFSLFGGSAQSYRQVTGYDFYHQIIDTIYFFKANGVPLKVKMPLLRQNVYDIKDIKEHLKADGISCKADLRIIPRFNGDTDVLSYRFTPEEILQLEIEKPASNIALFKEIKNKTDKKVKTLSFCLEHCQPFIINPSFRLQLCFFFRDWQVDLRDKPLNSAIMSLIEIIENDETVNQQSECSGCNKQYLCPYCPGWARNETGAANGKIPFLCSLTELYQQKYSRLEQSQENLSV